MAEKQYQINNVFINETAQRQYQLDMVYVAETTILLALADSYFTIDDDAAIVGTVVATDGTPAYTYAILTQTKIAP